MEREENSHIIKGLSNCIDGEEGSRKTRNLAHII